ncbi:MAG: hypothetical protein JO202_01605 [Ktedonobacteraceae bacterium]|nr:hypothetical protein [Ktedonobacteraceae bacterium]
MKNGPDDHMAIAEEALTYCTEQNLPYAAMTDVIAEQHPEIDPETVLDTVCEQWGWDKEQYFALRQFLW